MILPYNRINQQKEPKFQMLSLKYSLSCPSEKSQNAQKIPDLQSVYTMMIANYESQLW